MHISEEESRDCKACWEQENAGPSFQLRLVLPDPGTRTDVLDLTAPPFSCLWAGVNTTWSLGCRWGVTLMAVLSTWESLLPLHAQGAFRHLNVSTAHFELELMSFFFVWTDFNGKQKDMSQLLFWPPLKALERSLNFRLEKLAWRKLFF